MLKFVKLFDFLLCIRTYFDVALVTMTSLVPVKSLKQSFKFRLTTIAKGLPETSEKRLENCDDIETGGIAQATDEMECNETIVLSLDPDSNTAVNARKLHI